jgi:hypothetical protein
LSSVYTPPNCLTLQFATLKLTPKGTKAAHSTPQPKTATLSSMGTVCEEEAFPEIFSLSEFIRLGPSSDPTRIVSCAELI